MIFLLLMVSLSLGSLKCSLHEEKKLPKTVQSGTVCDKHLPFLSENDHQIHS